MLARTKLQVSAIALFLSAPACVVPAWGGPALLFDAADGKVLYAEDLDNQWHPASLTKIMTAYVTFEAIKEGKLTPATKISCSELANSQGPSKVGLPVGAEMTVETALQALIVKSANDVAVMLAEAVAGTHDAFVDRMNATAAKLGMTRTKFANANGLPDPVQVTTARDLAKLTTAAIRNYPEYAQLWSMQEVRVGKRKLHTHNGLLTNYAGADGFKTGFICDSGFNVVASATREGRKLVAVVLGEPTGYERSVRAASLLEHGFQTQEWAALFQPQTLDSMPMTEGAKGPMTMRQAVISYVCGTARRHVAKARKKKAQAIAAQKTNAKAVKKAAAAKAQP
jgi:D-alanyl-D-alanine carboxypeptidase